MLKRYRQTVYDNALRRRNGGGGGVSYTLAFIYTGTDQNLIIPENVSDVTVTIWGAGGGMANSALGGAGGFVSGILTVSPGETLTVIVGRGGSSANSGFGQFDVAYGGGGSPAQYSSSGGGGRSAIRRTGNDIVTVGAGGGSGYYGGGGPGGAPTGALGNGAVGQNGSGGGEGGTTLAGGAGGAGTQYVGGNGSQYKGGDLNWGAYVTGAGGSGYFGGGAGGMPTSGAGGGGGGGSSYTANLTSPITGYSTTGSAPNDSDTRYVAGVAIPAPNTNVRGGNGRVVVEYIS